MNNELDFNKYEDVIIAMEYDGFIDPRGYFYKVKPRHNHGKTKTKVDHNLWADVYMKQNGDHFRKMNFNASGLFTLSQISSVAEALVHIYGFVYYSHDAYTREPIIIIPNPKYNNCQMTDEQNDTLFDIVLLNKENPFINPIFTEDNVYSCIGNRENFRR